MEVQVHVETKHGIPTRAWREWTLTANVHAYGVDWLHAERGGQKLDIDEFLMLAPEFTREQLDEMARDRSTDCSSDLPGDSPAVARADYEYDRRKERA